MRTVWPANALMLALAAVQAPLRLRGRTQRLEDLLVVVVPTTQTRKKSALEEFDPWAR